MRWQDLRVATTLRRTVQFLLIVLVVQVFLVPQIGGARNALSTLSSVQPALLALGVALEAGALVAYAKLLGSVLPPGIRPRLLRLFGIVLASFGISHVLPAGSAAGGVLSFRLLRDAGVDGTTAGVVLPTVSIGSAAVLNTIFVSALLVSIPLSGFNPLYATAAGVGALVMMSFAGSLVALTRGEEGSVRVIRAVANRLPGLTPDSAERGVREVADRLGVLVSDRRRAARAVGWAAANWLLDAASLWVFLAAFGHQTRIDGLLVAYGLANILAALPITPGGLGIVEGVLIPTLVAFGVPRAVSSVGVISYRLVNFWLPIPAGGLAYLLLRAPGIGGSDLRSVTTEVHTQSQRRNLD